MHRPCQHHCGALSLQVRSGPGKSCFLIRLCQGTRTHLWASPARSLMSFVSPVLRSSGGFLGRTANAVPPTAQSHNLLSGSCPTTQKGVPRPGGGSGGLPLPAPLVALQGPSCEVTMGVRSSRGWPRFTHTEVLTWATQACAWASGVDIYHVHTALGLLALERRRRSVSRPHRQVLGAGWAGQAEGGSAEEAP